MTKTKKQLEKELEETREKLTQKQKSFLKYRDACFYAGKYLQVLRVMDEEFTQMDYDRVLKTLDQDKYLD